MTSHMFESASVGAIFGGTFTIHTHSEKSALDKLSVTAAHSALHNAPARTDESRCYQHTRTNVLDNLERWAQGICDEGASIFWLQGGAGAGKSAIMQSLAERSAEQGLALGSFFFFRDDPTRNSAEVLIPTLLYQLAQLFSSSLDVLGPIMDQDPLIFKKSFQVQLFSVLVPALRYLVRRETISETPQSPRVFLIDGLDECNDPSQQQSIIQAVAAVCYEYRIPVKFLIASRPEPAISASFERYKQENRVMATISLSDDVDAEDDIRRFVEGELLKIRLQHPFQKMIPPNWPSHYEINRLVWKSSSHFIYASTSMKYIWSAKENPVRSLQVVLGVEVSRTRSPFPELDALYHYILGSAAHRDKVLQILAHCIYAEVSSLTNFICIFLDCSRDDLTIYLAEMTPLVAISLPETMQNLRETEVKLLHASFGDFLRDKSRSGSLHINEAAYLSSTLNRCFQLLDLYAQQRQVLPWQAITALFHIEYTIIKSAHLFETRDLLRQSQYYRIRVLFQFRIHEWLQAPFPPNFRCFFAVLMALRPLPVEPDNGLWGDFMKVFFHLLESRINLWTPLGPAILPLMFLGYPAGKICEILSFRKSLQLRATKFDYRHKGLMRRRPLTFLDMLPMIPSAISHGVAISPQIFLSGFIFFEGVEFRVGRTTVRNRVYIINYERPRLTRDPVPQVDIMPTISSLRHDIDTSPEHLARAAEAMLAHLFDHARLYYTSPYSVHRLWLQRTKPGKHIAAGNPRLATVIHARCRSIFHLLEYPHKDPDKSDYLLPLSMELGLKYHLMADTIDRQQEELQLAANLHDALLLVLPKASFSEKIVLYSKRAFPRGLYQRKAGLCRRVRNCLDEYTTRVRHEKLDELGQGIENGDVIALIEKSRMLYLDAQD